MREGGVSLRGDGRLRPAVLGRCAPSAPAARGGLGPGAGVRPGTAGARPYAPRIDTPPSLLPPHPRRSPCRYARLVDSLSVFFRRATDIQLLESAISTHESAPTMIPHVASDAIRGMDIEASVAKVNGVG